MRSAYIVGLSTLILGSAVANAQNLDAIEKRRAVMKAIARAGSPPFQMMKGNAPFDLAKVQAALRTYQEEGAKLKTLFPDDSKSGGGTDAPARIWNDKAGFAKAVETFVGIARAAAPLINDEATFRAEYPNVAASCGGCHKDADGYAPKLADSLKKLKQ
jgi:cytochrome c556